MNTHARNQMEMAALGIARTEFMYYRGTSSIWRVFTLDEKVFTVTTHCLGSESSVLKAAARKLAERPVKYPGVHYDELT